MNRDEEYKQLSQAGTPYDGLIRTEADRQGVPYEYMHRLIFNESTFQNTAKSPTGPLGLGQFTEATGKAYGLLTPEDRMDPVKAVPAIARHLKDNIGKANGDLLKAGLMYNQGEGRLGSPQLAALDSGDLSKVSPEGLQYMRNLLSVAGESPSRNLFDSLQGGPGIHPKTEAVSFESLTEGLTANPKGVPKLGDDLPQLGNAGLNGVDVPGQERDFAARSAIDAKAKAKGFFEGTVDASVGSIVTSPLAAIGRYVTQEDVDPLDWVKVHDTSEWTREDYENIRKEGVDPSMFGFIMDYSKGKRENLSNAIAMAKENMRAEQMIQAGGTGAQIVGGILSAGVDPLTYVPVPGATSTRLISRAAQGAAAGAAGAVASEGLREMATGLEGHYSTAIVGGALFGAGASALFDRAAAQAVPQRVDVGDDQLEKVLALHGESALPNERFELHPEMQPDANDYFGPSMRLEGRETARQLGGEDPTRLSWPEDATPTEAFGVAYIDHPREPGAVILQDGSILSANNPLNPKTLGQATQFMPNERAAQGVSMGGFSEIGYTLLRSEDEAVRDVTGQLFRSPTGMQSGSNGKYGATASDIVERVQATDHVTYNKMSDQLDAALKDPQWATHPAGRQGASDDIQRRVAEAIEDQTGAKWAQLTKVEQDFGETVRAHYDKKADMLEFPSQFGNYNARSILPETRHAGSYIPNVYSTAQKALHLRRFNGEDGLQSAIVDSWLASYASRPKVKARVDKLLMDQAKAEGKILDTDMLRAAVQDYAERKAYGIAKEDNLTNANLYDNANGLTGAENNNFLEGRHLFDSDMSITMGDGADFAVNDLREFDLNRVTPVYDRRVNGDIAIMGATGKTTKELKDHINGLNVKSNLERQGLEDSINILTGRARRDPEGSLATAARALTDLSFFAKNAYMGVQSISEIAGMVTKGHTRMLLKGVPILREMIGYGSKIKPKELAEMNEMLFGRELDDAIRPRRTDIVERLRDQAQANPVTAQVVGTIKFATGELAARSPFTKFLTESSNYIADAGRAGMLSEIVNHAHGGTRQGFQNLLSPERLRSMSITQGQLDGVLDLIRTHTVKKKGGSYGIKDKAAFLRDPRSMDLWRMGDKIADETILRPHKLSSKDTVAYGAGVKMAMQFKNFTMRSVNSRVMRGYHEATKNNRKMDQAIAAVLSSGLALGTYTAMKYSQTLGMPKDQRHEFLKGALDEKMLAYAALSRSSHIGAPLGLVNIVAAPFGFDMGAQVRTSILPRGPKPKPEAGALKYSPLKSDGVQGFASRALEQVPAAGVLANAYQVGTNAFGAMGTDSRRADQEYMTGIFNGLRGLVPNDPVSQKLLLMLMESHGVEIR